MIEKKQTNKKRIYEKQLALRNQFWPGVREEDLWSHRGRDGFIPIPRVMPLVLQIMDDLAARPVSPVYFDLWCRKFDEQFVTLSRPIKEYAFFSGFAGQRAEQTWKERMKVLDQLGFIKVKPGANGPYSYALILNPIKVIERHAKAKTPGLRQDYLNTLLDRSNQVKARDLIATTIA